MKFASTDGAANDGSIVAFKVQEQNGKLDAHPGMDVDQSGCPCIPRYHKWFGLCSLRRRLSSNEGASASQSHATLYVLDGTTGKQRFSSGNDVSTFSHGSGLAIANDRVYFTTHDNTVYCYGFPALEPQLGTY